MGVKKRRMRLLAIGGIMIVAAILTLICCAQNWKWRLPYIDTANYSRLMDKYDGFVGMPLEEVIPLLTKDETYILFGEDDRVTVDMREVLASDVQLVEVASNGMSVLCFPVQNSRSREECFIKGFLVNKQNIVSAQADVWLSTDRFFKVLEMSAPV